MNIETLATFFMWCTIINLCIYALWTMFCIFLPDFVYRLQSKWFPIPRESFNTIIYSFLGVFKIFFVFFNVTPYVALKIIGG